VWCFCGTACQVKWDEAELKGVAVLGVGAGGRVGLLGVFLPLHKGAAGDITGNVADKLLSEAYQW
jgi:hypothetical protein